MVVQHELRDKIEEKVNALGPLDPRVRISKWASAVTEVINEMDEDELAKYQVKADEWRNKGPPKAIQRK